ncbi:hypothetical protein ACFVOR_24535 [Streptomyces sp. NPDC057837]|uniref:hypothetical protein n=1 Tax=Streptomyces sp. NPDC057837 TaxID=3346260 RepID=UPI0036830F8E
MKRWLNNRVFAARAGLFDHVLRETVCRVVEGLGPPPALKPAEPGPGRLAELPPGRTLRRHERVLGGSACIDTGPIAPHHERPGGL